MSPFSEPLREIELGGTVYRVGDRVRLRAIGDRGATVQQGRIQAIHPQDGRTFFTVVLDDDTSLYVSPSEIDVLAA